MGREGGGGRGIGGGGASWRGGGIRAGEEGRIVSPAFDLCRNLLNREGWGSLFVYIYICMYLCKASAVCKGCVNLVIGSDFTCL